MENIAIFYGGKSVEHEVSIITALQVMDNINKEKYKIFPVYIDHNGAWWKMINYMNKGEYKNLKKAKKHKVFVEFGSQCLFIKEIKKHKTKIDVAINVCHGTQGEDGCLQGVFELLGIPYSSAGVMASAVCMNKIVMKQLFEKHGLNITKWQYFKRDEKIDFAKTLENLKFPLFVKPANLGSSVGISKCENLQELEVATSIAFGFDEYIIVEEGVENLMEINCSVQKKDGKVQTSELEVPVNWEKFLTYENKYVSKTKGQTKTVVGADVKQDIRQKIEESATLAYEKFFLDGVIRIDYLFNKKTNELFINEINTIPGSLSFYLWKPKAISFSAHISNQIEQAKQKAKIKDMNITKIQSPLLDL